MYLKALLNRTQHFLRRLRWRCYFFLQDDSEDNQQPTKENFGFPSNAPLPVVPELAAFEDDVYKLVGAIKFRHNQNPFLDRLDTDVKNIKSSPKTTVPADKTNNLYQLPVDEYMQLIQSSISAAYKKAPPNTRSLIDNRTSAIASNLGLMGRQGIETMENSGAFILLKDHKPNFETNLPRRLINPAKSCVGKISKSLLDKINSSLRSQTRFNQWQSTGEVLSWFKANCEIDRSRFLQYDIEAFYPSISEELLNRAVSFARSHIDIPQQDVDTIFHSRLSLLFCPSGETWQRKESLFDVTMGAYDGAEICELVGLYLLHRVTSLLPINCNGLYRDDGLIMIAGRGGSGLERIRKDMIALYRSEGLNITISAPSSSVDFLDVNLRSDGSFRPFRKADQITSYVHQLSNHPPSIIKNLPAMIERRLNDISSNEEVFNAAKPYYEAALERSGYQNPTLKFEKRSPSNPTPGENQPRTRRNRGRNRKRNITWFNPPFSTTVQTNVAGKFLQLLDKHFPPNNPLHKILNRNCVKVSYSTMSNMERIMKNRNRQLLQQHVDTSEPQPRLCNCRQRDRENCPLQGKCQMKGVIYKATVSSPSTSEEWFYIGLTANTFKTRYNQHNHSFRHKPDTELSRKVWELKDKGLEYNVSWKVIKRGHPYKPGQRFCDLCAAEKLEIIRCSGDPRMLNERTELIRACMHKWPHRLKLNDYAGDET